MANDLENSHLIQLQLSLMHCLLCIAELPGD